MRSKMKRLKLLEEESTRLKRLVADHSLAKAMLHGCCQMKCMVCPSFTRCMFRGARTVQPNAGLQRS
jgi:hypothetical protein